MKIKVLKPFRDKFERSIRHEPGTVIDIDDKERADDIISRGLGKAMKKPKKTTSNQ